MSQVGKLTGKTAIVTGAGGGIGQATALRLAALGADVVAADINLEGAERTSKAIEEQGGRSIAVVVDVGDEGAIIALIARTIEAFGRLDVLHNNAAALGPDSLGRDNDVMTMDVAVWNQIMQVNLAGPMLASKHALPHMINAGGGSIINTSSSAAFVGDARLTAYGASKAALNTLTLYIATQYGKQGVRCNAIAPGLVLSSAVGTDPDALAIRLDQHLTPRLGLPDDIAHAVAFLASDESAMITAQVLHVDGGYISHTPWLHLKPLR